MSHKTREEFNEQFTDVENSLNIAIGNIRWYGADDLDDESRQELSAALEQLTGARKRLSAIGKRQPENASENDDDGGLERPDPEPLPGRDPIQNAINEIQWGLMAISGSADGLSHENVTWNGAPYISILVKREADRLLDTLERLENTIKRGKQ